MENIDSLNIITSILRILKESRRELRLDEIKSRSGIHKPILLYLLWLQEVGFVQKVEDMSSEYYLLESKWRITPMGRSFLKFLESNKVIFSGLKQSFPPFSLVLVYPRSIDILSKNKLEILSKKGIYFPDLLKEIFSAAQKEILISSPFIDQTIVPFLEPITDIKIEIVTNQSNQSLRRLAKRSNVQIYILREGEDKPIFQLHSKFICVDGRYCVIGSMNLNERSMYYNFETGIFIDDENLGSHLREIFSIMKEISRLLVV